METGDMIKLPKKGDLSQCKNWRGVTLLTAPGKVVTRAILERLEVTVDKNCLFVGWLLNVPGTC